MKMTATRSMMAACARSRTRREAGALPGVECDQIAGATVVVRSLARDADQKYYLYIPSQGGTAARTFIPVHGITRNAVEQAEFFAPFAERYGVVLIAPLFPEDRFRDYQRLGRAGKGERADAVLHEIVAEVGSLIGSRTDKLYLFGYSGGGQFVHRYTMAHPERVARIVVAAAGWYTFPDPTVNYPMGIKQPFSGLPDIRFNFRRFLSIPTCVMVGESDVRRDHELRRSGRIDRQQGITRLERGKRWVKVMRAATRAQRLDTPYLFRVLPRSSHSFAACMERGKMGREVFDFLFGAASESNY